MRHVSLVLIFAAACGIQNKVAPDGVAADVVVTGDGSGSGSATELTITLTDKPAELGNMPAVRFGFATSVPAPTECRVDGDAYAPCTSPVHVPALIDGMHAFDVRASVDGQDAAAPTYSFTIDTKAPALALTGQPPLTSPVATAQFHFTIDDATTVTCQLDAQAAAPCTSPISYSALADGSHTFTLTGSDGASNTATKTYTWTVDTSAPTLTITSEPADPSATATAQFQFTTGNSASVTCQLDSGAATACVSPVNYSSLADGAHTFTLKGTSGGGITTTRAYTWTVDTTAPAVTITSAPAANTNATTAQFIFTVAGATTVTCQLDTGPAAACTSPWPYAGLADGAHTFTLKAIDAAGNTTTKAAMWSVDTTPPIISITGHPTDPSNISSPSFTFTTTGATIVTCQLDGGAAAACTSPTGYSSVADGSHTFTVKASDAAGNTASQSYTWMIDTTPPVVTFGTTPSANTNVTQAAFTFSASGATSITCQLDGGTPFVCSSSYTSSALPDGTHTFTVRGTDAAGNVGSATFTWNVDTVAPVVTVTGTPGNSHTATISFTSNEGSAQCILDQGAWAACSSPVTYTVADGAHFFALTVTDAAGNSTTKNVQWGVDTTPPTISVTATCNAGTTSASWTVSDASTLTSGTCTYSGTNYNCLGITSMDVPVGSGGYFWVSYTDAYGNTASQRQRFSISASACNTP